MKALRIEECGFDCPQFANIDTSRCHHPEVTRRCWHPDVPAGQAREILATDEPFPEWCPLDEYPEKGD